MAQVIFNGKREFAAPNPKDHTQWAIIVENNTPYFPGNDRVCVIGRMFPAEELGSIKMRDPEYKVPQATAEQLADPRVHAFALSTLLSVTEDGMPGAPLDYAEDVDAFAHAVGGRLGPLVDEWIEKNEQSSSLRELIDLLGLK